VIIVGFGRMGTPPRVPCETRSRGCRSSTSIPTASAIEEVGAVPLVDDGREEQALRAGGIDRAAALVAAAHDDATNLVVVLTARSLRPDLRIVARVNDPQWRSRMVRAGADASTSPYESVGALLATSAIESSVIGLQDLPGLGLRTEEIEVRDGAAAIGCTLRELAVEQPDVLLLGLRDVGGLSPWHEVEGPLQRGDVVIALGSPLR
jgi:voltage-gated potassium channel